MPTKSTRQRILDILTNHENATAAELSRALSVTQADVRYHVSKMVEEGLIIPSNPLHSGRRGRPARNYTLASKSLQDNYELLSGVLLTTSLEGLSAERKKNIFTRLPSTSLLDINPLVRLAVASYMQLINSSSSITRPAGKPTQMHPG